MSAGQVANRDSGAVRGGSEKSGCTKHTSASAAILNDEADGRLGLREADIVVIVREVVKFGIGRPCACLPQRSVFQGPNQRCMPHFDPDALPLQLDEIKLVDDE